MECDMGDRLPRRHWGRGQRALGQRLDGVISEVTEV